MNEQEIRLLDASGFRLILLERIKDEHWQYKSQRRHNLKLNQVPSSIKKQYAAFKSRFYMVHNILVTGKELYRDFETVWNRVIVPESNTVIAEVAMIAWLTTYEDAFNKDDFLEKIDMPILSYGLVTKYHSAIIAGALSLYERNRLPNGCIKEEFESLAHKEAIDVIVAANKLTEEQVLEALKQPRQFTSST